MPVPTSVSATVNSRLDATVVLADASTAAATAANRTVSYSGWSENLTLTSATTPAVGNFINTVVTLSGGAATLDLTAITDVNGLVHDITGKKVVAIRFRNLGANTLNIAPGASNGYDLWGASNDITIQPGMNILYAPGELGNAAATPTVASGDRTLDFAGSGSDTVDVTILVSA